ncbi:MAG: hypothetical protein C4567_11285 [Deltaproteobacteria bacterium]|nr:MAG: hypothetical protein C4567_11285 [Deltaproteobacteria bacterium]
MGFDLTIQSLGQVNWQRTPAQKKADPKPFEDRGRAFDLPAAQTPGEALAQIKLLSKTGRIDELVALLRNRPLFRKAWQTLQQSQSPDPETASSASLMPAPEQSGYPVFQSDSVSQGRLQTQDPALGQVTAASGPSPEIGEAENFPITSSRPTLGLAVGRQVYETQAGYYTQERANLSRISLKV